MAKPTRKEIEQLAELLAASRTFRENGDEESRQRFLKAKEAARGRRWLPKVGHRRLIDIPKAPHPGDNNHKPHISQWNFQPRTQRQMIEEGENNMFAEGTLTARRAQPQVWHRVVLAAAVLAIALFGAFLARNVSDDGGLQVALIRNAEDINQDAFTLYIEQVWNQGNVALLSDVAAEGITYHDTTLAEDVTGIDDLSELVTRYREAMLDFTYTVDAVSVDEDRVWAQVTASGTHTNTLELMRGVSVPASMNTATWSVTIVSRFEDGRIAETWVQADTLDLMQQIGAVPLLQELSQEEENIAHVEAMFEALYNSGEYITRDDVEVFFAEEYRYYGLGVSLLSGEPTDYFNATSGWLSNEIIHLQSDFPGYQYTINEIFAQGDTVTVHLTFSGTYSGFIETGNRYMNDSITGESGEVRWHEMRMYRIEDGKIVEVHDFWNRATTDALGITEPRS